MMKIKVIRQLPESLGARLRVAAYARVSMDTDKLLHSLSAQVTNYRKVIQENPEWEYAGVYVDEGITGTRADIRKGFTQLMADCDRGLIDMVLVKSISRFSRNTVDCIKAVRHLKEHGIAVFFERENINSLSAEGEFMLTLMASYAQEESRSISENVRWHVRKRFEKGIQNGVSVPFGYFWDGDMYRVLPEQGAVVKDIFARYLAGQSAYGIAKHLADKGITGNAGRPMEQTTVKEILSNAAYTGCKVLQKYYIGDDHKRRVNRGELPRYEVDDMYEVLVSQEDFCSAQEIRRQRAERLTPAEHTVFSGKIKCGYCRAGVSRRSTWMGTKRWNCNTRERSGISSCDMRPIGEDELMRALDSVLKAGESLERATLYADRVEFVTDRGSVRKVRRDFSGKRGHNAFSGKVYCGSCGSKCRRANWRKGLKMWHCMECHKGKMREPELLKASATLLGDDYQGRVVDEVFKVVIDDGGLRLLFKAGGEAVWRKR